MDIFSGILQIVFLFHLTVIPFDWQFEATIAKFFNTILLSDYYLGQY